MSTIKVLAKKVFIPWPECRKHNTPWRWFETQDRRRFNPVNFFVGDYPDVKIYLVKKLSVHHSEEWGYELYEVPRKDLAHERFPIHWKYFSDRQIVYEVKK